MKKSPHDMLILDGSGYLYFVKKGPQATPMTRQEMREKSPSGLVSMDPWLGRSFTFSFLGGAVLVGIALTWVIDWAMMNV